MLKTSADGQSGQSALTGLEKKLVGRDPEDSAIPASVRKAVRFMLGGGAMTLLVAVFWLIVAAAFLTLESISGRAWWTWVAAGAGVAALLTLWLDLSVLLECAAFLAASLLGLVYSLQMRLAAARLKLRQQ